MKITILTDGHQIEGRDADEIVAAMQYKSPFTADQPPAEFMVNVLKRVEGEGAPPLAQDAPAADFLQRLAAKGMVVFGE